MNIPSSSNWYASFMSSKLNTTIPKLLETTSRELSWFTVKQLTILYFSMSSVLLINESCL